MKALKIATFMAMSVVAITMIAMADIDGTKHDFEAATTWNDGGAGGTVCGPCHTPHNANGTVAPLWSHTNTAVSSWQMYSNSTMQASQPSAPNALSLMCLSCHDGTIALDAFVGDGDDTTVFLTGSAKMGSDLRNDHPISILYDATLAGNDTELYHPTNSFVADKLFSGYVECSSCHDPHGVSGVSSLLREDNTNSELCLKCHNK